MNVEKLIEFADQARENAYTPYSHFRVGAALLCEDGTIYTGCNIENAAYGPSNCAERTAVFKAVSEGKRRFRAIAIIGDSQDITSPCGVCRQVLSEFCGPEFVIIMCNTQKQYRQATLGELLPYSFGADTINS